MKGIIIRGVGIFLLIASIIALLVLYHCLSRIKKGEQQETTPLPGNGSNEPREITSPGAGNHQRSISDNSPARLSSGALPFRCEPQ